MSKLMGYSILVAFLGTAAVAAIPEDAAISADPTEQQAAEAAPLRVAPYTKTNAGRHCLPVASEVQARPAEGATRCL